jgi:hypothetical protein
VNGWTDEAGALVAGRSFVVIEVEVEVEVAGVPNCPDSPDSDPLPNDGIVPPPPVKVGWEPPPPLEPAAEVPVDALEVEVVWLVDVCRDGGARYVRVAVIGGVVLDCFVVA